MIIPDDIPDFEMGRVVGTIGMPGTGKTENMAQIIGRSGIPTLAFDTVGELSKILDGKITTFEFPPMDRQEHFDFVNEIWHEGQKLLLSGQSVLYDMRMVDPSEIQDFLDSVTRTTLVRLSGVVVAIDEMQDVAAEPRYGTTAMRFANWLTKRRNQMITFVYASQRFAFVNAKVRGITDYWLLGRQNFSSDLKDIKEMFKDLPEESLPQGITPDIIRNKVMPLQTGEFVAIDFPFKTA